MLTYSEETLNAKAISAEELKKQERMRDVTLLLQQIVEREEVALKLIIDSLIDVGSVNYANNKLHNPPLNKMMKVLLGYIKPVARMAALIWLKRNLPNLLTTWLEGKVSFENTNVNTQDAANSDVDTQDALTGDVEIAPSILSSKVATLDESVQAIPKINSLI